MFISKQNIHEDMKGTYNSGSKEIALIQNLCSTISDNL